MEKEIATETVDWQKWVDGLRDNIPSGASVVEGDAIVDSGKGALRKLGHSIL